MASLANHSVSSVTKMMIVGDTGGGKTGALASLAAAGYNLRIIDLDNGVDVLANLLSDPASKYGPEALARVEYVTLTDKMKNVNGRLIPARATVWQNVAKLLDTGKYEDKEDPSKNVDWGPITSWTPREVLVVDTLTMLSNGAMNFILTLNARMGQKPFQSDFGDAQQLLDSLMQMLYDDGVNCNIVVNTHITYIGEKDGPQRGYPSCVGRQLPQKIGRYFNSVVLARSELGKRKIMTSAQIMPPIELKTSAPMRVKPSYPIESGLADLFKDLQGSNPVAA